MKVKNIWRAGFTLVELLVVISIIGILAALALTSYTGAQRQARDSQRKSDLKQYQTALEAYANINSGFYPLYSLTFRISDSCARGILGSSISGCPEDPRYSNDPTFVYNYQTNGITGVCGDCGYPQATRYVLWAKLESTLDYWVICSNGRTGTKPQANFSVSDGNCPL